MTERIGSPQTKPRLSVVIPTYNRAARLQSCLEALVRGFPADAEVIVVNDGGDRDSFPDLSPFEETLHLSVIHDSHGGPACARNIGLRNAAGEVVAFTDDDCLPLPNWLERLAAAVRLDPPEAAGGRTLNGLPGNTFATAAQLILDMGERDQRRRSYGPAFYPSNNIAFPTAALRTIGGFDESFRTSEDRELCRRWQRAGFGLVKAPDAVISHAPDMTLRKFWRKYVSYGSGAARFHGSSDDGWRRESAAFHRRVPALAWAEMAEQRIEQRASVSAALLLWEFANLTGYLQGKWSGRR